jgi:hypothetical protein
MQLAPGNSPIERGGCGAAGVCRILHKEKEILTGRARRPAPTPHKITDNRQIFTVFVEATRQLSVVAPKLVKMRITGIFFKLLHQKCNSWYNFSTLK